MAKAVIDTPRLSPEAREWLDSQAMRLERHVVTRAPSWPPRVTMM
jgi:hypothetical protein